MPPLAESKSTQPGTRLSRLRHELRTPLNHIIGYSEMLLEQEEDSGSNTFITGLQQVHAAGEQILSLVNRLLDPAHFSRETRRQTAEQACEILCHRAEEPLAQIFGHEELLRVRACQQGRPELGPDLHRIAAAARTLRASLLGLRDPAQTALLHDAFGAPAVMANEAAPSPALPVRADRDVVAANAIAPGVLLVVDDDEMNRDLLARRLQRQGHTVITAEDGAQALAQVVAGGFDLVLLDLVMPGLDGLQVLQRLQADPRTREIPVLMISALEDVDSVIACIEAGAEDYLPKPFNPVLLRARVNSCLEKKRLREQKMYQAQLATIFALAKLAESRDPETGHHLERIGAYCEILARQLASSVPCHADLTPSCIANLRAASALHDIGKVGIPDHILCKPGKLTAEEFTVLQRHTVIGADTLLAVLGKFPGNDFLRLGVVVAESHHEKWDGSGYPYGLSGARIPLPGRILALADVYDALTSHRCYHRARPHQEVRGMIVAARGQHFDPEVVDGFVAAEEAFHEVQRRFGD
jgi:putative two-component system response regulator